MLKNLYKKEEYKFYIFLVILLSLTVLMIRCFMPLDKIDVGYDIIFHYRRFNVLMDSLDNNCYPIYMDFKAFGNYGYGTRWFYPDLILIPFAYIANFTNFVFAYKFMLFTMTLLCGIITYKSVYYVYKNDITASIAALLYTFLPYRIQDIYERGAVGESISFTFLPIVFVGLYMIIKGDYKKWYVISIGFVLLIYTHLLTSVFTFFTVVIFICIYYKSFVKEPKRILYLLVAGISTILLSAYYILPFIEQLLNITFQKGSVTYILGTRLNIEEFSKSMFYPYSVVEKPYVEPIIGCLITFTVILRVFIKGKTKALKNTDICTLVGLFYLLLCLVPWNRYPLKLINFIQFPYRLFEYIGLLFSISGAYYLSIMIEKYKKMKYVYPIIVIIIGYSIIKTSDTYKDFHGYYTKYNEYTEQNNNVDKSFDYNYLFTGSHEYLPKNLSLNYIIKRGETFSYNGKNTIISDVNRKDGSVDFDINVDKNDVVELPLTYYKGYTAKLNNKEIKVKESNIGLVEIPIDESGKVTVLFSGTFLQKYSIYLSLISFIMLLVYIYISKRKTKHNA